MNFKNICFLFFSFFAFAFVGCKKEESSDKLPVKAYTGITKSIVDRSTIVSRVFSDTTIRIVDGVEETEIHFLKEDGYTTRLFVMKIDLKTPGLKLKVATPYDSPGFGGQTLTDMAKYVDQPGQRVVGGVNGDFYDISNYVVRGVLHKNGVVIKNTFTSTAALPQQGLSFIGILNNGKPHIGYKDEYPTYSSQLKEATGGGVLLMKDGKPVNNLQFPQIDPRIAIGYTKDDIVYFIVIEGRDFYYSNGATYAELTKIMNALDIENGINLDGGGSTTMMIRNPLANVWQVRNRPSDGSPRAVSNGWLVVADEP